MSFLALEDIYDLSTEDLNKIRDKLRNEPAGQQNLLETIQLEIEERKALEYFSDFCKADNPYTQKVSAFNEEFLKLAAEAIQKSHNQRNQGIGLYEPLNIPTYVNEPMSKNEKNKQNFSSTSSSMPNNRPQSGIYSKRQLQSQLDTKSIVSLQNLHSDTGSKTTQSSIRIKESKEIRRNSSKVSSSSGQIKIKKETKKGTQSKAKQRMMSLLASTKVEEDILIKRGFGDLPVPPQPTRKYHIPGEKHENIDYASQKSHKRSENNIKSKNNIQSSVSQETKNKKPTRDPAVINKTKQIQARMKQQQKKGTVKLPKLNKNKDFVEMVRMQEQRKKERASQQNIQRLPQIQTKSSSEDLHKSMGENKSEKKDTQTSISKQHENDLRSDDDQKDYIEQKQERKEGMIQKKEIGRIENEMIKQQEMQQSLTPKKIQKLKGIKNEVKEQLNKQSKFQEKLNKGQNKNDASINLQHNVENKVQFLNYDERQGKGIQFSQTVLENSEQVKNLQQKEQGLIQKQTQDMKDYSKKLIQQIQMQENNQYHFFKKQKNLEDQNEYNENQLANNNEGKQFEKVQNRQQSIAKKCYSEEYWAHIREQAELKIKRFRQQKQYEEQKQKQKAQVTNILLQEPKEQQNLQGNQPDSLIYQKLKQEQQAFQKEIALKQQKLNKMKKQMMKKTTKVPEILSVPKIIRPKPQFDYLSVYPTFNHIFSVMYLKPVSQALSDIPNIMREIKTLFTTHVEHFSKKSNFKPAIFLPFDNNGTFQLTNPKQMIAHAQQTYIDLKTMIERVEIFNQNLHGNFSNDESDRFFRVIKTKQQVYDIITTSFMRTKGWKQLPHGCSLRSSWNLFWSWSKPDIDLNKLLVWQRINHFPFNKNLTRKDLLYKNLDIFRKNFKIPINFLPLTFNLPKEFSQLSAKFHQQEMINRDANYWIMKPIGKSRGRGIKVVSSLSELNYIDNIVVQKYIANPMLIDGYKFDMRIYALVTNFHPLQAFVYREGFARLSTQKYSLDPNSIKNTFVHLTNFSINKNNVESNTNKNFSAGSKISLKSLKDKITRMGHSFTNIWSQVHDIIIKSLLGCSVSVPSFPTAFQLFGYDIMIDTQCNCHLIQINASPSLQRSYMLDEIVKQNLIDDIVDIVEPQDFDKKQLLQVFTERINAISNNKKITTEDDLYGLARILKYKPIRKIGEKPSKIGLFEMIAPCDSSRQIQKLIKARSGANNPMNID